MPVISRIGSSCHYISANPNHINAVRTRIASVTVEQKKRGLLRVSESVYLGHDFQLRNMKEAHLPETASSIFIRDGYAPNARTCEPVVLVINLLGAREHSVKLRRRVISL